MQPRAGYGRGARGNRSGELHGRQKCCSCAARTGSRELPGARLQKSPGARYGRLRFHELYARSLLPAFERSHSAFRHGAGLRRDILPAQSEQEARSIFCRVLGAVCTFCRKYHFIPAQREIQLAANRSARGLIYMRRRVLDTVCTGAEKSHKRARSGKASAVFGMYISQRGVKYCQHYTRTARILKRHLQRGQKYQNRRLPRADIYYSRSRRDRCHAYHARPREQTAF